MNRAPLAAAALALAACLPPSVTVTPAGTGLVLPPRPADCTIEFLRTKPPERPYDEVAALHLQMRSGSDAAVAQEALRKRACALGADGVVVTRDFALGLMTGTAVSYRDLREQHRIDAVLARAAEAERAAKLEEERAAAARAEARVAAEAASAKGPPADYVKGRAKERVRPRATPERRGVEGGEIARGSDLWMAPRPSSGWRRVWAPGGTTGWVEDSALEPWTPATADPPATPPRAAPAAPPASSI